MGSATSNPKKWKVSQPQLTGVLLGLPLWGQLPLALFLQKMREPDGLQQHRGALFPFLEIQSLGRG